MTDLHSHVLPGMDDGSRSVEESLQMLAASAAQGVTVMAATPHFYPHENNIEQFLARRAVSAKPLQAAWAETFPRLLLGAEVYYFDGIDHAEGLGRLQIGETGLLLLEMPFAPWSERMVDQVIGIHARQGVTVVLAHIERYFPYHNAAHIEFLRENGIQTQCNAEFFLHWRTRRKALRMLRRGEIDLLGSDCHNMGSRRPRLGEAAAAAGTDGMRILSENISRLLPALEAQAI